MKITLSDYSGFCAGVRRADKAIREALEARRDGERICTIGPLIHNSVYTERLRECGVEIIDVSEVEAIVKANSPRPTTVFIRTHGIESHLKEELRRIAAAYPSLTIKDLTCPSVSAYISFAYDSICTISDSLITGEALSSEERQNSFREMMEVALECAISG